MPDLDATLHVKMVRPKKKRRLLPRIIAAIKRELASPNVYGLQWGDPDIVRPLRFIRDRYVLAYVRPEDTPVEIGPGAAVGRGIYSISKSYMLSIIMRSF